MLHPVCGGYKKKGGGGVVSHKQMFLLISSRHVSAQIGHHQAILEEHTNGDIIQINFVLAL
jgi:hypothetical protein